MRLFEECLALLLGLPAATESLGLTPFDAVVVETDGSIEQVDSLKSAYEGAAETGLDVFRHDFDEALRHPGVAARQAGLAALADTCRACPLVAVCGGGHYAHRYRAGAGFTNPSVYCADLQRFIHHVAGRLAGEGRGTGPEVSGTRKDAAERTVQAARDGGIKSAFPVSRERDTDPPKPPALAAGADPVVPAALEGGTP